MESRMVFFVAQWVTGVMITPTSAAIFQHVGCWISGFAANPLPECWIVQCKWNLVKLARDLTRPISPKWWFSKGNPRKFQGNLGWWNIMNHLPRWKWKFSRIEWRNSGLFWMEVPMEVHQQKSAAWGWYISNPQLMHNDGCVKKLS